MDAASPACPPQATLALEMTANIASSSAVGTPATVSPRSAFRSIAAMIHGIPVRAATARAQCRPVGFTPPSATRNPAVRPEADRCASCVVHVGGPNRSGGIPWRMARARNEASPASVRLSDGTLARVVRSAYAGGWELDVDGTPQSHVDLDDPTHLHFEYVARMGAVIDRLRMPRQPLTAVHLGAGALTMPRYVEATRPGSRQQVIELEPALLDLVRDRAAAPPRRARSGCASATPARDSGGCRRALVGNVDLLVSDVYSGAQTPAHLTTVEFYTAAARLLAPEGVLLVNVADGAGLAFARRQVATVRAVLEHVIVLAEVQTLKGRRFGNLVIAASRVRRFRPSGCRASWRPAPTRPRSRRAPSSTSSRAVRAWRRMPTPRRRPSRRHPSSNASPDPAHPSHRRDAQ